jgi:polysaccharide deacetylase family protein (PEP-CTERM system associated)
MNKDILLKKKQEGHRKHILTIGLEDYFNVGAFEGIIQREQWYRFETRFEQNTRRVLNLLDSFNIKATFIVLGWIADRQPEIIRQIVQRGHEIACTGYAHKSVRLMSRSEFNEDLVQTREAVEKASGQTVYGYRACQWLTPRDLWVLDALSEMGFIYDTSIRPLFRSFHDSPDRCFKHIHKTATGKNLWEFPISSWNLLGLRVPIAGGNYFRQFPHTLLKHAVEHWHRNIEFPFVMYFHIWELDTEQPVIHAASWLTQIRHYRNLGKMPWVLDDYFRKYQFGSVAEHLGLERKPILKSGHDAPAIPVSPVCVDQKKGPGIDSNPVPVSIIVPVYNEELALPYLANTLASVEGSFSTFYDLNFIFVDDGSSDGTWDKLNNIFGGRPNCLIVRHQQNQGVAAAILTGIQSAATDIVCSIDCDCTYDPHELERMIPLLVEGVDMVTASPYHPEGHVRNVPGWRLILSRGASFLYRHILKQNLHTYTSCFRVYRRSAFQSLELREKGFFGITELLALLIFSGSKIAEYPATLEVRMIGFSKMKTLKTVVGHLKLLGRFLKWRFLSQPTVKK